MFSMAFYAKSSFLSQSYFNTDFQTLQTTKPDKVLHCASAASVFSELEHRERTLILFQNSACPGADKKLNLSGCQWKRYVFCILSRNQFTAPCFHDFAIIPTCTYLHWSKYSKYL